MKVGWIVSVDGLTQTEVTLNSSRCVEAYLARLTDDTWNECLHERTKPVGRIDS